MTWFRVDVGIGDHELVGAIVEGLEVSVREAVGLYVLTLAGFAEYQADGVVKSVTNTTLEEWAKWRGVKGRFATFFRSQCVESRQDQRDAPGVVKGWWRQRALLEKQLRDAAKPAGKRRVPPQIPRGNSGGSPAGSSGYVDEDEDENGKNLSVPPRALVSEILSPVQFTIRCTAAANRGLRENPAINGFNELVSSAQDEPGLWQTAGIPIDVAEAAIYQRAKAYRPKGRRTQPTSLGYFRLAVEDEWSKAQGRAIEGDVNTKPAEQGPSDWVRRKEAEIARQRAGTH